MCPSDPLEPGRSGEESRSAGDGRPVDPAAVTLAPTSDQARVDLDCDECGAPLKWSPREAALLCEHCGTAREVLRRDATIVERPLRDGDVPEEGLGLDLRVLACETCGARTALAPHATADRCPFCGSARVLDRSDSRRGVRPESLIPLEVGREGVEKAFAKWIGGLWFRPNALKRQRAGSAVGVYVPAWTFDANAHSKWTAQSGTYYWVTESYTVTVNGRSERRTRQVRKVRWRPASGQRRDSYDDVQVLASKGIDSALARKLGGFDTEDLVPYRAEYLAGWRAEEYQLDLDGGWAVALGRIQAQQRSRCAGDVPGDTHRALRVRTSVQDVRWKHVLLPIWSVTYSFKGRGYAVLVHGQSGRVVGRAPLSWWKILGLVLAIGAVAAAIALGSALGR